MKQLLAAAVLVAATVLATRWLWPHTETVQLPGYTDTVRVTEPEVDSIIEERVRWRETVTTDTVTLTETRYETDTVYLAMLEPRWYLQQAQLAERGDTSTFDLVWLAADSSGIRRRRAVESQVALGPVREIRTDAEGLHVDYREPRSCPGLLSTGGLGLDLPLGAKLGPGATAGFTRDGIGYAVGVTLAF